MLIGKGVLIGIGALITKIPIEIRCVELRGKALAEECMRLIELLRQFMFGEVETSPISRP